MAARLSQSDLVDIRGSLDPALNLLETLTDILGGAVIEAGFLAPEADREYAASGQNVATIAYFHEFGTENADGSERMPERPFMRRAIETDASTWADPLTDRVLTSTAPAIMRDGLRNVAGSAVRSIHNQLQTTTQWAAPLTAYTVSRKNGNAWPLHDTLQMSYSLSAEATDGQKKRAGRVTP